MDMINTLYTNVDLILKKQRATTGEFFEVNNLSYEEVILYTGEMILFNGFFYIVETKTTESMYKRESFVKSGRKIISKQR
jgi:hypothetical protein